MRSSAMIPAAPSARKKPRFGLNAQATSFVASTIARAKGKTGSSNLSIGSGIFAIVTSRPTQTQELLRACAEASFVRKGLVIGWLVGWLASWLVGWLVSWFIKARIL